MSVRTIAFETACLGNACYGDAVKDDRFIPDKFCYSAVHASRAGGEYDVTPGKNLFCGFRALNNQIKFFLSDVIFVEVEDADRE